MIKDDNPTTRLGVSNGTRDRLLPVARLMYRRFFPYPHYFILTVPFFALLLSNTISIGAVMGISYLLPCVFALMAMFAYNELCDADIDPVEKNIITSGKLQKNDAILFIVFTTLCAIISAMFFYDSITTFIVFCSYVFFCLAYSGLKLRFKTTLAGPFVASYILWAGPSLLLLTEFSFWNNIALSLLIGIFLVFSAHELHHQIDDYPGDKKMNVRTLAVRFGPKVAFIISVLLSVAGFLFMLYSIYFSVNYSYFVLFASLFSFFIVFQTILASTKSLLVTVNNPVKLSIIAYAGISLGFPSLLTLLILIVFLAENYGFIQCWTIPIKFKLN